MLQMRGGTSGNRTDSIVPMPEFDTQPMQNTAGGSMSPMVQMRGGTSGNREANSIAPMPLGGTPNDANT